MNNITFYSIAGLPAIAWGGLTTFLLLLYTAYLGYKGAPVEKHKLFATITIVLAIIHGLAGLLAYL